MDIEKYKDIISTIKNIIVGTKWEGLVYSVGGCVRDSLLNRPIKDIDLVVTMPNGGIDFANWLFENNFLIREPVTYPHYGTAMFHLSAFPDIELEAVQTRKESYRDMETRNPETAYGTIQEDCKRRDFTYNAIYYNISRSRIDDYNGNSFKDLKDNVLRASGEPEIIFNEDPLRILRAVRFATNYDSKIEHNTYRAMELLSYRLSIISKERIQDEFNKMIMGKDPIRAITMLNELDAFKFVFPNMNQYFLDTIKSNGFCFYEGTSLKQRITSLLTESIYRIDDLKYLKYSNEFIDYFNQFDDFRYILLYETNVFNYSLPNKALRKLQLKAKNYDTFFDFCLIINAKQDKTEFIDKMIDETKEMIENGSAMFGYQLPINGDDVMAIKNIGPSKKVKEYLDMLMDIAYTNPFITKKDCEKIIKIN